MGELRGEDERWAVWWVVVGELRERMRCGLYGGWWWVS